MAARIDERTGLEIMDPAECVTLLARHTLGRIAVVDFGGRPVIFPVNYAVDNGAIVFRTDHGTKLHLAPGRWVAFECDGIDRTYHTGWSVLACGIAEEVHNLAEVAELERLPLGVWSPGRKPVWVRIRPQTLSGRRIPPHGRSTSDTR